MLNLKCNKTIRVYRKSTTFDYEIRSFSAEQKRKNHYRWNQNIYNAFIEHSEEEKNHWKLYVVYVHRFNLFTRIFISSCSLLTVRRDKFEHFIHQEKLDFISHNQSIIRGKSFAKEQEWYVFLIQCILNAIETEVIWDHIYLTFARQYYSLGRHAC